jgi:hypothetical protein
MTDLHSQERRSILRRHGAIVPDAQLGSINSHFLKKSQDYIACGEDAPTSISVTFEWMFPVGRNVTACFDGEVNAFVVEDASAL